MKREERSGLLGKMAVAIERIESCREFAPLVPEVRTNLVFASETPQGPHDVVAVDGRITVVENMPRASGRPKFGASSHMARLLIALNSAFPGIRSGVNFASTPHLARWLTEYCEKKGWTFSLIDRKGEPEEVKEREGASMGWKAAEAIRTAAGKVPKLFYETGAIGKEPVSVLVGGDPIQVADEVCELAREYAKACKPPPKVGKIDLDQFESFLLRRLGREDKTVIVPPLTGVDAGVIDVGDGKVLIVAEDPIFSLPKQPLKMFGWYTVHIGASDVAVMGVKPRYMTYTLLMPPETSDEDFRTIVDSIHETAAELDIAIVGGHTGYYPTVVTPLVGGITVFALADKDAYVTPAGAQPGDDVILTKGPAIEAAGILAVLYEKILLDEYPAALVEKAKTMCSEMTVVKDALTAMEAGGITAMHDATEGGVMAGLYEIANASAVGMKIDESAFVYPEEVKMVCEALNMDPVTAIAEGSLLITLGPTHSQRVIKRLADVGIESSIVGKVTSDCGKRTLKRRDGSVVSLAIPHQDPFWPAFFKGLEQEQGSP